MQVQRLTSSHLLRSDDEQFAFKLDPADRLDIVSDYQEFKIKEKTKTPGKQHKKRKGERPAALPLPIDYGCKDDRFLVLPSCVTISNPP
jgi:hypothetical protein